jgi:hypothetical protein
MKPADLLRRVVRSLGYHPTWHPTWHPTCHLAPVMILALCLMGCKDKGQATARPRPETTAVAGDTAAGEPTSANLTPDRKGTGEGWRWQGNRAACMFLVGKQCFDKRETACEAAGCSGDACKVNSAVPALVSCKGK